MQKVTTQQREDYEQTELGELPSDWSVKTLKELNSDKKKNITPLKFSDEVFEYYSIPAYQNNQEPVLEKGKKILSQKVLLDKGTVLFGKLNPRVEKVWIVKSDSEHRKIGSTEWITVFPDKNVCDPEFLYYMQWSQFVMPLAKDMVSGSTPSRQRVKPTSYYQIKVPLPPLSEQKKIANVLSAIQSSIQKTDHIINSYKELKKSMMKHLFTYGPVSLEEAEKIKLIETEIGMINEEWELDKLGNLADTFSGGTPNRNNKSFWKGNIPWAKSGELKDKRVYQVEESITEDGLKNSSAKYVEPNTLLIAMYGATAGKVGISTFKFTINQAICAIKPNEKFHSDFYFYFLMQIREILLSYTFGGAQPNLNQQIIKNLIVPKISFEMQEEIANILTTIDYKIDKECNNKKSLEVFFKSMLNNLMSAKVRVNELEIGK